MYADSRAIVKLETENNPPVIILFYSNISICTGLIKDYLRELPEPLFTKAMFDMMVDGLSVCLPDDPNGNSKLMFSIIECLSDINAVSHKCFLCLDMTNCVISRQACVQYVMDHLKLVTSHSDKNKMNSQSLSQIFGPLFTCYYESENIHKSIEVFKFLLDLWPAPKRKQPLSVTTGELVTVFSALH